MRSNSNSGKLKKNSSERVFEFEILSFSFLYKLNEIERTETNNDIQCMRGRVCYMFMSCQSNTITRNLKKKEVV